MIKEIYERPHTERRRVRPLVLLADSISGSTDPWEPGSGEEDFVKERQVEDIDAGFGNAGFGGDEW